MNHELQKLLVWALVLAASTLPWLAIPHLRKYVPPVVLQIAAGFALGPVILGALFPDFFKWLLPLDVITSVSSLGFAFGYLFVFITGLHIHFDDFPGNKKMQIAVLSLTSFIVPFSLGVPTAYFLGITFPSLIGEHGTPLTFALSLGIAASVTALPVLSAILYDMGEQESEWGRFIISIAVVLDAFLWIGLTVLLMVSGSESEQGIHNPWLTVLLTCGFLVLMVFFVKRYLEKIVDSAWWSNIPDPIKMTLQGIYLISSGIITQLIGVHYLIGAVVSGAVWPNHTRKPILKRMEVFIVAIGLPLFFASAGIRTNFDITSMQVWFTYSVMTVITYTGLFFGVVLVLRYLFKTSWYFAVSVGIMLSCKGIAELVVLGLLNSQGIISNEAYAGMVMMALTATAFTKILVTLARKYLVDQPTVETYNDMDQVMA